MQDSNKYLITKKKTMNLWNYANKNKKNAVYFIVESKSKLRTREK